MDHRYDCIIIGAGVTGAAAARELSRYQLRTLVLEQEEDVCAGTSKANSGLVHAGFDALPGTLKAEMNVKGSRMMPGLCRELDVPYRRNGALVTAGSPSERESLERLLEQGKKNGVEGLSILEGEALRAIEPNLSSHVQAALLAETAGIVCPFELTIALAENASVNGVEFSFQTRVERILKKEDTEGFYYEIHACRLPFFEEAPEQEDLVLETRMVVNCAGVAGDTLHNQVSGRKLHITPRRGEYCLLDQNTGRHVQHTVFAVPGEYGKGILVTPTVHGNLLLGPTAEPVEGKDEICTTQEGLEKVLAGAGRMVKELPLRQVITSFAGLRATEDGGDFILEEAADAPGFVDAAGIESPGLSSAPAIGERLAQIVAGRLQPVRKEDFISVRKGILRLRELPEEEQRRLIRLKPAYGNIICRCETVTEGEVLEAICRPLGARSLDGVKRRTRAGMGRCQGGFCSPKVVELLAETWNVSPLAITKSSLHSRILLGRDKEALDG